MEVAESAYVMVPRSAIEQLFNSFSLSHLPQPTLFDPDTFLCEFELACRVDYRLNRLTIRERLRHVKRLLKFLGCHPLQATREDLRRFLELNPAQNAVKALRVLYGRFLESDLASCFRVPQSPPHPIIAPTHEVLRETYDNLDDPELEAAFLVLASSGLRRHELMELTPRQIDMENRIIYPGRKSSAAKFQWITCFNDEAKAALIKLLMNSTNECTDEYITNRYIPIGTPSSKPDERVFTMHKDTLTKKFKRASDGKITPQILRDWFCCEMGRLGVPDRYVDAFCGRVPKAVIGRYYTDYSPERLKEIYDGAGLVVLGGAD